jgi:hypothetical protein
MSKGCEMVTTDEDIKPHDLESDSARAGLSRTITALFTQWKLTRKEQLILLGLSESSKSRLRGIHHGKPFPKGRDFLDRAGYLLSIHTALRLLYPRNEVERYSFIKTKSKKFNNGTPLDLIENEGFIGLAKVARYLNNECNQDA